MSRGEENEAEGAVDVQEQGAQQVPAQRRTPRWHKQRSVYSDHTGYYSMGRADRGGAVFHFLWTRMRHERFYRAEEIAKSCKVDPYQAASLVHAIKQKLRGAATVVENKHALGYRLVPNKDGS